MNNKNLSFKSLGHGANVVCLHSSLSSSKQWAGLMTELQNQYQVTAIDLYGYGKSARWAADRPFTLDDEVAMIESVLEDLQGPVHLVGHSYGAAVALKVAQKNPEIVRNLIVYEPVLFNLLLDTDDIPHGTQEIFSLLTDMQRDRDLGRADLAISQFVNYWSGEGSWERFSAFQQSAMIDKIDVVMGNFYALVSDKSALADFAAMQTPVHYLLGEHSRQPIKAVAVVMQRVLPNAHFWTLPDVGHMAPITHSELFNAQIQRLIENQDADTWHEDFRVAA